MFKTYFETNNNFDGLWTVFGACLINIWNF